MKTTQKQKVARARNWNKRMVTGILSSLSGLIFCNHMRIGLTPKEMSQFITIKNLVNQLLIDWKKTV